MLWAPSSVELCQKEARCSGDGSYLAQCKQDARDGIEQAKEAGCSSEYSSMSTCLKKHTSCEENQLVMDSFDACDEKFTAFTQCLIGISF